MSLHTYLPQDRLRALSRGETLPDRTSGSALFADISGFTPLTETLTHELGPRRGIEELTRQVNAVYDTLITEIEKYGGSVISFAGDAITCWFDEQAENSAGRAVTAALALHSVMAALPQKLGLKIVVTTGLVRRLVVGEPASQLIDTLFGATVARLAAAEQLATSNEVLIDEATAESLTSVTTIGEWRPAKSGDRFAVVTALSSAAQPMTVPAPALLEINALRPWILPAIFEREHSGHGAFLTELRPATALFLRFTGIDYDQDEQAGKKLSNLIARIQAILTRYASALLQLNIGDKGSYLYAVFGAPIAHEDDARRAVKAALELQQLLHEFNFLRSIEIGISSGMMRTGAYGGLTRRTYGALGDEINVAARLMETALPGEILLSGTTQKASADYFDFKPRAPLLIKGKTEPLAVFAVTRERRERAIRLQEPTYALPMIGRQAELHTISEKLDQALNGQAQIIGIVAEAGLGKSRLVAEVIRLARRKGFIGYGGACQSDAVNTPYQVWNSIWSAFFALDPELPLRKKIRWLESELEERAPQRAQALPLLGALLNLAIPDNAFTQTLEPKDRQSTLHALLENCLKTTAQDQPLLIVVEDVHWIDALSHDLLDQLARAVSAYPIVFVLAYRPPQLARLTAPRLERLPNFTKIELTELNATDAQQIIHAKLAQLYPTRLDVAPPELISKLMTRAQGNPFYLEELLNYLRDRGLDPLNLKDLQKIELPNSLHALILSRIDQLTEREKTTLRVASIIGRLFRADWLTGYYPALGDWPQVKADLADLHDLDITQIDSPEPELAYIFKHIVTQEVTYESLPFATRTQLHEQLARFIEKQKPDQHLDLLAFHYSLSENVAKQREYLQKAGEAAQTAYAHQAALSYFARLLPLLSEPPDRLELYFKRAVILELAGQWSEAEASYQAALDLSQQVADPAARARCQRALGVLAQQRGDHSAALAWLEQARVGWAALNDPTNLGQAFTELGIVYWRTGDFTEARYHLEKGLVLAREANDRRGLALALNNLANVIMNQGDYGLARTLYEETLTLRRETSDKRGISVALNNIGNVAGDQGDNVTARQLYEESLALRREIGDKQGIAASLNNLGIVAWDLGDHAAAQSLYEEVLVLMREIGDNRGIAIALNNLGELALNQGDATTARRLQEEGLLLKSEMGDKRGIASSHFNLGLVAIEQQDYPRARTLHLESLIQAQEIGDKRFVFYNLAGLATVALAQADAQRAVRLAAAAEILLAAIKVTMQPYIRRQFDRTIASARRVLGDEAFASEWTAGERLTMDEAIKYALQT